MGKRERREKLNVEKWAQIMYEMVPKEKVFKNKIQQFDWIFWISKSNGKLPTTAEHWTYVEGVQRTNTDWWCYVEKEAAVKQEKRKVTHI